MANSRLVVGDVFVAAMMRCGFKERKRKPRPLSVRKTGPFGLRVGRLGSGRAGHALGGGIFEMQRLARIGRQRADGMGGLGRFGEAAEDQL